MQDSKALVISQVDSVRAGVNHQCRSNVILNIGSPYINANPDVTATTPPSDDAATMIYFLLAFHA